MRLAPDRAVASFVRRFSRINRSVSRISSRSKSFGEVAASGRRVLRLTLPERIAARLAERGVGFVDAPVSGGVSGAMKGTLTIMCGGDEAAMARARPVLEAFGEKIVLCGPIGAGHAVKAVNQAMLGIHIWSLSEGLVALQKAGVSTATALDVINSSSGRSNTSMNLFPERVSTRAFPRTFKLALMDKDVRIAADFAREHGVSSPLMQLASELLREARRELGEEADHVETVKVLEQWAGVELGERA